MPILPMIEREAYSLTIIEPDFVYLQEKYTSLKNSVSLFIDNCKSYTMNGCLHVL